MSKLTVAIRGMHCKSCEIMIEKSLKKLCEVNVVNVDHKTGIAHIYTKGGEPSAEAIAAAVQEAGYEIGEKEKLSWISTDIHDYKNLLAAALILAVLFYAAKGLGIFELNVDTENMGYFVVLLIGLVAGVSTCMALVGGLVLALSARHAELHPEASYSQKFRPHIYFNLGRIIGYGILGGVIGMVGSVLTPSANTLGIVTIVVGSVMIFLGLKLIEIFPFLRDKTLALPKSISRALGLHKENREYSHSGSFFTGALTFFLPCGFTQAMQLYAVSTGSFGEGALVMSIFALGTAPGLVGIGWLSSIMKGRKARLFFMIAGLAVILLGGLNIANGSQLIGARATPAPVQVNTEGMQEVRMNVNYDGYSPNTFTVEKGKTVKWIIDAKSVYTCAAFIVMPKMGISTSLRVGENILYFTPTEAGEIPFSCSMGMYRGVFKVK